MFLLDISFRQEPGRSQVIKLIIYPFSPWRIISWFLLWFDLWFYHFHDLCQEPIKFDGLLFMSFMINLTQPGRNASKKGSSPLSHGPLNAPCLPPTPPPKKKLAVTIVSNFSWVLQSSQEKSKTMVMHKVHYGVCENGEFTHLWLKISVFLSFQSDIKFNFYCSDLKWHSKMPLTLLGLLEPDRFKKWIFWTGTELPV